MNKYIVLDLEMCDVPKGEKRITFNSPKELIQIGAVEMDEQFHVTRTFVTYVKPEFGEVTPKIQRLTRISPEHVKDAPTTKEALELFSNWLPETPIFVTWSENDANQIDDEIYFKDIDVPKLYNCLDDYIDCQELFSQKMNADKHYRLSEALAIANIDYDPAIHDALVDAKNTALLFSKIQKEETLVLSPYFMTQEQALSRSKYGLFLV